MHELSIVEGILETVVPKVQEYDMTRILKIKLKIGEMSGVIPQCINECFEIAAEGTIAEGAEIVIEKLPVRIKCADCAYEGPIELGKYTCPKCGGVHFKVVSGKEYFIDSVEAE